MSRHARIQSSTRIYHIVVKGADRLRLFEEYADYQKYLDILAYYKQECHLEIFAYCLMSNHVHLLIRHPEDITLQSIFRRINTTYAGWFNLKYQRTGFLQNDRFHSEPVEDATYLLTIVKYIHKNPLNAGLEPSIGSSYPWSSYHEYVTASPELIDSEFILSEFGSLKCFQDFHISANTESEQNCLDVDKIRQRLPDDVAQELIQKIS
ncbi:MAG: transposase, partial [Eubacteriales bacterium]|nr:transposase [Eubacteriales bacterium]